jgi:hypothetical protein
MIFAALIILGASLTFLSIAFVAVLFCIVLPMREELAKTKAEQSEQRARQDEHEDTIARNAGATIGLYMVNRREINELSKSVYTLTQRFAYVESQACPELPEVVDGPITKRQGTDECPVTSRSER